MWGNQVSPRPCPREGLAFTQGDGDTGFPHSPTRGRVCEGYALPRIIFIPSVCGAAAWTATVNIGCSPTRMRR